MHIVISMCRGQCIMKRERERERDGRIQRVWLARNQHQTINKKNVKLITQAIKNICANNEWRYSY